MSTVSLDHSLGLLGRLVEAAGWQAHTSDLIEAVPHLKQRLDGDDFVQTLRNLDYPLCFAEGRTADLSASDLPALFVGRDNSVDIILNRDGSQIEIATTAENGSTWRQVSWERGTFVRIDTSRGTGVTASQSGGSLAHVRDIVRTFSGQIASLLLASFLTNLISLCVPILIMVIYDRAIPTSATDLIIHLGVFMLAVFAIDFSLRRLRAYAVAHMGAAMEQRLGLLLFRKLSSLPVTELEKNDVEQQLARLKQFESMRELFSGPVFNALLDSPFILLFLGLIFFLSPQVGGLMLLSVLCFGLLTLLSSGHLSRLNAAASQARTEEQKLLFETIEKQRWIGRFGISDIWARRHAVLSEQTAEASRKVRSFQVLCQSLSQLLTGVTGVGAICLGTVLAIQGAQSLGVLIALMSLIWKTLSPINALFSGLPQLEGLKRSSAQIDRVLALAEEQISGARSSDFKHFAGDIQITGLTHRFAGASDTSLTGVTLDIQAGSCVVISGENGSGKSCLLEIIDGLRKPVMGQIHLDGITYEQIGCDDLRRTISFARQTPDFFHGTVRQNFQLAAPDIDDQTIEQALKDLEIFDDIAALPEGLDTRLSEQTRRRISRSALVALALARTIARPSQIILLDDPDNGLDPVRQGALIRWIKAQQGRRTVVIASNSRSLIQIADRCIHLHDGRVTINDTGLAGQRKVLCLLEKQESN